MGHERVGSLPKTKRWRQIVERTSRAHSPAETRNLTASTLSLVKSQFTTIGSGNAFREAFVFFVELAVGERAPKSPLSSVPPENLTPLNLAIALRQRLEGVSDSNEYKTLIRQGAGDALARWYSAHDTGQKKLFEPSAPIDVWRAAGSGGGFCELSRHLFAGICERYLLYFLDREAGRGKSPEDLRSLRDNLSRDVSEVSKHAFETAAIAQSYAAGWFNKWAKSGMPDDAAIDAFLQYAFAKMRSELNREATAE